jgi:hypothetical protein
MHNFRLVNVDTDALSFCRYDGAPFSDEEQEELLSELNGIMPKGIKFDHDGYFQTFIVAKSKNYYMVDEQGKHKVKGSAFKSSKMEIACKELQKRVMDAVISGNYTPDTFRDIYNEYVREIWDLKDPKRWSSRKTISEKVLKSKRKNERAIVDALRGEVPDVGSKVWLMYDESDNLMMVENWTGNHSKSRLLKKIFSATNIFTTFLDTSWRINYSLKGKAEALHAVLGIPYEKPWKPKKGVMETEEMSRPQYWTEAKIREVAKECATLAEFRKKYPTAYTQSLKLNVELGLPKSARGRKPKERASE